MTGTSPFALPAPGLRIRPGAPALRRPTAEEIEAFPREAAELLQRTWSVQKRIEQEGRVRLDWVQGKHFLLAGATGAGLGGALAVVLLHLLGDSGSLTVIGRDLSRSLGHETGRGMKSLADELGHGHRFHWLNTGLALEGGRLEEILAALREAGASRVIYVNTVAAASCGLLPGQPPVYVKDVDAEGIFQWELLPLDERSIEATRFVMGGMAVAFPRALEGMGVQVEASAFADWRGSLDLSSRDPASPAYGRQGAYSTSLYLPKEILQEETASAYGTGRVVIDVFFPVMNTRALGMIPGGVAMYHLYGKLLAREGLRQPQTEELALGMLERIGRAVSGEDDNPFPRLDGHEAALDLHFLEVVKRLNTDEDSDFYYQRWL